MSAPAPWLDDEDERDDEPTAGDGERKQRESQATALVRLAVDSGAEFFRDPAGEAFASILRADHRETYPLRSRALRAWLASLFYKTTAKAPSTTALNDAANALEGRAMFDGDEHKVWLRVAEHDGAIFLDLGRDDWQVVEIRPDGWRLTTDPPVRFRRPRCLAPLPVPARDGRLGDLREFVNVSTDDDFVLLAAFLTGACRPTAPQPVLNLMGEQGSGKTVLARAVRSVLDPSTAPLRSEPKEPRDLAVGAGNQYLVAFDNLSHLSPWLSDALCRLSTGGAFATRELYSNADETVFDAIRPTILTGIEALLVRGDLADRAITIEVPVLGDAARLAERTYWRLYAEAQPSILGGLCHAVAAGLAGVEDVHLDRLPRLADFAEFVVAAEVAGQWPTGAFLAAYLGNRERANEVVLDGDPVAAALRGLGAWQGTAGELLERLNLAVPTKPRSWPQSPRALTNVIRRLTPALRRVGCRITFERSREGRLVVIESSAEAAQTVDPASAMHDEPAEDATEDLPQAVLWPSD